MIASKLLLSSNPRNSSTDYSLTLHLGRLLMILRHAMFRTLKAVSFDITLPICTRY